MNVTQHIEKDQIEDGFMKKFKFYKANKPPPSLAEVINVDNPASCSDKITNLSSETVLEDVRTQILGIRPTKTWQAYSFQDHPGLLLIRNPFTSLGQRYWIRKCLEEYPRKPNKLNIDNEILLEDWWRACHEDGECNKVLLKKLRWTTLGYHHNWDTKVYSERNRTSFPRDLAELCDVVAEYLGYRDFRAEAAIVNYYHMNSTLSAHTDHSEVNLDAPLFSFSFGQSAIFLIGGNDKSIEPSAVLLQSGDVMVMSKEARLCYHAVPKILPAATTPWSDRMEEITLKDARGTPKVKKYIDNQEGIISMFNKNSCNEEWSKFSEYVDMSRINVNVRQVLYEDQRRLDD